MIETKFVRIRVSVGDTLEVLDVTGVFSYVKVIGIFLVVVWLDVHNLVFTC